jgi:hypothetical protein
MFKTLAALGALAVAAPTLALAQGNSNNMPAAQKLFALLRNNA